MKTPSQLRRAIETAGGTMEEDEGVRDMRTFQAVAPNGMIWEEGVCCIRVDWAKGSTAQAVAFNEAQFESTVERMGFGLRKQTAEEQDMTATD